MLATLVKRVGKKKHALRYMSGERMGLSMIQSEEVMEPSLGDKLLIEQSRPYVTA